MKLAQMQSAFQAALLKGGDDILAVIPDSPREKKETLFGVYRDGYVLRLLNILQDDFARLHTYIGDEAFDSLARAFIAAHPSHTPNARYYGQAFPAFVATREEFASVPMVAAIATLEGTLNDIFDCADTAALTLSDLAAYAPDDFARLTFAPHPSARRFDAPCDLAAVFTALSEGSPPPGDHSGGTPQHILVWRKDVVPHYRALCEEEAMMWDEAAKGVRFCVLCEMLATYDDPDNAPLRAAGYLQSWITSGLLGSVSPAA